YHAPCVYRALYSFPTRRSSDLGTLISSVSPTRTDTNCVAVRSKSSRLTTFADGGVDAALTGATRSSDEPTRFLASSQTGLSRGRSEEHTSELQSRENLVCRLLL